VSGAQSGSEDPRAVLRAHLLSQAGLIPAIDAVFAEDPGFCSALLTETVRQRFAEDCDIRDVTAFVARAAARAQRDGPAAFRSREAEAVIRIALGESELMDELDITGFDLAAVVTGALAEAFAEWQPLAIDLDDLLARAGAVAAWIAQVAPPLGRPHDALRAHVTAIPADISKTLALAEAYRLAEMWSPALAAYDRAVAERPDLARPVAGRGMAHQALGQLESAVADYSRALELDPDNSWTLASRATAYRLSGQYDLAVADYDRSVALDPAADWVLAGRAETYLLLSRYEEALADFAAAIELDPADATHRLGRGQALEKLGRHEEAAAEYRAAAALDPSLDLS
jgi:tetratricopeptide (TPR) repeat protein